jgi:hypothetical protein
MMNDDKIKLVDAGKIDEASEATGRINDKLIEFDALLKGIDLTKPFDSLLNVIGQIGAQLGPSGILTAVSNLDSEASKLVKSFGISKDRAGELVQTIADAVPKFVGIGLEFGDIAETMKGLGESMNTNMMVSSDVLTNFAATSVVTGVAQKDLSVKFRDVGVSIGSIGDKMLDVVKIARQAGATVASVSEGVVGNLDKMNLYNFEGGVKGLAKMAAQASRLGIEMSGIFSIVNKVFDPEGAIEFAASLQRLGVTSSQLLDPLRLMDLAQNDPTELQNQIVNMTKEFTIFNKENNQIEILPGAKRRIDEIGKAMGYNNGELQKMAVNAGMFDMKLKQIKFPTDIATKEDRELIATMAQINDKGIATVRMEKIDKEGNRTGEYVEKMVSELNTDDVKKLAEQQKNNDASIEDIAKNQLTELKKITTSINAFVGAAKYGIASSNVVQTGYKASLGTFQNLLDEKIPQNMKKSENYRTGTDEMVNKLQDLLKISGISDYISQLTTNTKTYLETLGSGIKNVFGSGGVDTEYAENSYGIPQQTNTINTNLPNQKIETENNIKVDFKVTTDENISPKTKEDINSAIDYYFNGPDGPSHIQMLLNLMPKEATSNGLIKKP